MGIIIVLLIASSPFIFLAGIIYLINYGWKYVKPEYLVQVRIKEDMTGFYIEYRNFRNSLTWVSLNEYSSKYGVSFKRKYKTFAEACAAGKEIKKNEISLIEKEKNLMGDHYL